MNILENSGLSKNTETPEESLQMSSSSYERKKNTGMQRKHLESCVQDKAEKKRQLRHIVEKYLPTAASKCLSLWLVASKLSYECTQLQLIARKSILPRVAHSAMKTLTILIPLFNRMKPLFH